MILTSAALIVFSVFSPAPIGPAITEVRLLTTDSRAPWFFLWVQQMLKWGDPFLWGVLAPVIVLMVVALIPYFFPSPKQSELGQWFPKSNRLAQVVLTALAFCIVLLTILNIQSAP
jgi:quinol-cytochrome oxidoreductase complex cytochrome b subunit